MSLVEAEKSTDESEENFENISTENGHSSPESTEKQEYREWIGRLVMRIQAGDAEAWNELYAAKNSQIFAISLRMLRNRHDAREMSQNVWMQVHRKIGDVRDPLRFSTWLSTTTRRMALNFIKRSRDTFRTSQSAVVERQAGNVRRPIDQLLQKEESVALHDAIEHLREPYRIVAELFYLFEYSLVDIADVTKRPVGTIKRQLHTSRSLLRELLVPEEF